MKEGRRGTGLKKGIGRTGGAERTKEDRGNDRRRRRGREGRRRM